jgi:hypothetical protein
MTMSRARQSKGAGRVLAMHARSVIRHLWSSSSLKGFFRDERFTLWQV